MVDRGRAPLAADVGTLTRRLASLLAGAALIAAVFPAAAIAHGIVGRADLPIPPWLFAWAATIVMVISFVALFALRGTRLRRLPARPLFGFPALAEWTCGVLGVLIYGAVVYAGLAGAQVFTSNLAPTFVFVVFWVGVPLTSALVGDLFRALNPWRAAARLCSAAIRVAGREPRPLLGSYPARVGRWPAAMVLAAFAWLELVYPSKDDPHLLAMLALVYAALQLLGMAAFGVEAWTARADGFSVYFGFFALLAPLRWQARRLYLQWPLLGARRLDVVPGTVAVFCALIGSTGFDGFSNGEFWLKLEPPLQRLAESIGFTAIGGYEVAGTIGLLAWILLVAAIYRGTIWGVRRAAGGRTEELSAEFIHTLLPVAFGYTLAHYFSLLVLQGQAIGYLVSDPLGHGSNLFGTAEYLVNYNLVSFAAIWYVQILAIVGGHVGGLVLSHEQGLGSFRSQRASVRAQQWMLVMMIGFTCLGLWILSAVTTTG